MSEVEALRQQNAALEARVAALEGRVTPPAPPKVNGALTSRLDQSYLKAKPKLQHRLVQAVALQWSELTTKDNLQRSTWGTIEDLTITLPKMIAQELTRQTQIARDLDASQRSAMMLGGNESKLQRLEVELAAVTAHTADLITTTTLPPLPDALLDKVTALNKPAQRSPYGGTIQRPYEV